MTIDEAIEQACGEAGIYVPKRIVYGRWLNTDTTAGKSGRGDGRLIVNEHSVTAWNWQTSQKVTVNLRDGMSAREQQAVARDIARAKQKAARDAERAVQQAHALIGAAKPATHLYLVDKGFKDEQTLTIGAQTVRDIVGDYLVAGSSAIVIPARRAGGITSVQLIWEDGTKKFLFGGEIGGSSHRIATGPYTWLCEGYATGLSIRQALRGLKIQATVLCCFSASNIVAVARQVKGRAFVAADNDKRLEHFGGVGTGEHYARQTGLPFAMPTVLQTDFNDMHQAEGIFAVQRVLTATMSRRRAA